MKDKFLLINCSSRKNGNSASLLMLAKKHVPECFECEILNLNDYNIAHCNGCLSCVINQQRCVIEDSAITIIEKILAAKAIILAAPVYFLSANSVLKILLDRFLVIDSLTDYQNKIPASILLTSGRPGWEGLSLPIASLFLLSCGCEVKAYEIFHAQGPGEVFLDELISEKLLKLINTTINSQKPLNPSCHCPICLNSAFVIKSEKEVSCPVCNISGKVIAFKEDKVSILFDENDLINNRWVGNNLKEHMQDWVGASVPRYKERIREVIRKKRELLNTCE